MKSSVWFCALVALFACAATARAHPLLQHAIDVVIGPDRIAVDARISADEVMLVETPDHKAPPANQWPAIADRHAKYVRDHLQLHADGTELSAKTWVMTAPGAAPGSGNAADIGQPAVYHLEYALTKPPGLVTINQNFLREYPAWSASCVVRTRQTTEDQFTLGILAILDTAQVPCNWESAQPAVAAKTTSVNVGATIREYVKHGIRHILTGYDHMLFVSALVLAATRFWDLIKVVTAFTVAHTITLALSVFNIVTLSEHIVEPMIAASIVFVAAQNIFWPERSRGWARLAVAFGFGLFHGLGFAGGLKDAMNGLPSIALWSALGSFSLGVEIGHQMVVIPLFTLLRLVRPAEPVPAAGGFPILQDHSVPAKDPCYGPEWKAEMLRSTIALRTRQVASSLICVAGAYFFVQAIRM